MIAFVNSALMHEHRVLEEISPLNGKLQALYGSEHCAARQNLYINRHDFIP